MTKLSIGLVKDGIHGEVLEEILNHQGLIAEEINPEKKPSRSFPCVIVPTFSDEKYELARKNCLVEKGIVIADKEIRLDDILRRFAGETEAQGDRFSRPDTNESEHRLFKRIEEVFFDQGLVMLRKWFWPDCRIACCVLTHDVDWFYYSPWHRAVFRRRTVPQLIRLAYSSFICRENFGNNVSEMVQMEKQKGLRSSFYFLPKYNRNFEEFTSALRMLREEQLFEVGLHGYYSHDDFDKLSSQKMTLEKHLGLELKGIRQHALNFVAPTTWEYEERAGFLYDLTFHFNEKFGFRAGMCFPYHPFSLAMKKRLRILEMPTSIIDYTILYRRLSEAKAAEVIEEIEATVESFNGLLLTCFHNTYMNKETFPEIVKIYGQLLEDVCKKGYWIATAQECCQWWLEREKTHIVAEVENNQLVGRTSSLKVPVFIETPDGKKLTREFSATSFRIDLANT